MPCRHCANSKPEFFSQARARRLGSIRVLIISRSAMFSLQLRELRLKPWVAFVVEKLRTHIFPIIVCGVRTRSPRKMGRVREEGGGGIEPFSAHFVGAYAIELIWNESSDLSVSLLLLWRGLGHFGEARFGARAFRCTDFSVQRHFDAKTFWRTDMVTRSVLLTCHDGRRQRR